MSKSFHIFVAAFAATIAALAAAPDLISNASIATFHNANGTINNDWSGGGTGMANFFNGKLDDGVYIGPNGRAANGCYVLLNFTGSKPNGYFITDVAISEVKAYNYSLYYSVDGTTWTAVEDATPGNKIGTATYGVNDIATHIKVVFDQIGGWNNTVSEIQVWGLDPADVTCSHKAQYLTAWVPVQGTANCTERGIDQRQCTNCGELFTRESETLFELGHDYQFTLLEAGSGLQYGSGTITCSRHDLEIACTNGPVDMVSYGGVQAEGIVQFMNITVSSTGQTEYGVNPHHLIDNNWTMTWNNYWFANSKSVDEYVQFDFGIAIDLTSIEISVPNKTHTLSFYAVDNGVESLIGEHAVEFDSSIPSGNNNYQRFTVNFFGVSLKTLRIKSDDSKEALRICEVHPYGTVKGAGKVATVRTRVIID